MGAKTRGASPALLGLAAATSGAAAVAFEVLWVRRLGDVLGHGAWAVGTVLAVFFLGLGVGAALGGRLADRLGGSIGLYVALEVWIAVCGLLFLPATEGIEALVARLAPAEWPLQRAVLSKALAAAAVLAPPTLAMGASLPALVRNSVRGPRGLARRVGWLYGANTVGAAIGALAAVFVLLPRLGLANAMLAASLGSVVAAGIAWLGGARVQAASPPVPHRARPDTAPPLTATADRGRGALLATAAVSGFVAVGFEVLWTRALAVRFENTVYGFAVLLGAYLLALGAGAMGVALLDALGAVRREALAVLVAGAGLAGLISVGVLARVPLLEEGAGGFLGAKRTELLWSLAVMAPSLLLFGAILPLTLALAHRDAERLGSEMGGLWLANTAGSVLAPLLVGFVALPRLGLGPSLLALAWLMLLFAVAFLAPWAGRPEPGRWWLLPAAAVLTFLLPSDLRLWQRDPGDRLVAYREGIMASLAVVDEAGGDRALKLNRDYRLGTRATRFAQQRQGLIPLLLHPDPRTCLVIGMGTGCSAGAVAEHGGVAMDVLEIVPELADTLPFFADVNGDLARRLREDPDLRLLSVDARHFVRNTERRYDVVIGDLFVPWRAGEGAMYAVEHLSSVRRLLSPGGLFCQWLPLYQLRPEDLEIVAATFRDVFPHAWMMWLYFNVDQPVLGLVGFAGPRQLDLARLERGAANAGAASVLERAGLTRWEELAGCWIGDGAALAELAGDAWPDSEAHPRIEFEAPRRRGARQRRPAAENVPRLLALTRPLREVTGEDDAPRLERAEACQRAIRHLLLGLQRRVHESDFDGAIAELDAALQAAPELSFAAWLLERLGEEARDAGQSERALRCEAALQRRAGGLAGER